MSCATLPQRFVIRLLTVALLGGASLLLIASTNPSSPVVYSMAAVRAALLRAPGAWAGRAVRVDAVVGNRCLAWMAGSSPQCVTWQPALLDPSGHDADVALPLQGAPQAPFLASLRRLPLVGRLVPAPQQIRWGAHATYRVRLRAAPARACGAPPCYWAVLLNAAPDALPAG